MIIIYRAMQHFLFGYAKTFTEIWNTRVLLEVIIRIIIVSSVLYLKHILSFSLPHLCFPLVFLSCRGFCGINNFNNFYFQCHLMRKTFEVGVERNEFVCANYLWNFEWTKTRHTNNNNNNIGRSNNKMMVTKHSNIRTWYEHVLASCW